MNNPIIHNLDFLAKTLLSNQIKPYPRDCNLHFGFFSAKKPKWNPFNRRTLVKHTHLNKITSIEEAQATTFFHPIDRSWVYFT